MMNGFGKAQISAVEYFVPSGKLTNEMLSSSFPEWSVDKIAAKTGIHSRRIASVDEFSSTMAAEAARKLLGRNLVEPHELDYIILCTQTPDFLLPTTACLVHRELELNHNVGAIDVNQGCSGFVYSLGLAKGLIETGQAKKVMLLTADTYSKLINPADKSVRTIFGDGATATLLTAKESSEDLLYGFTYGTDGSGAEQLITTAGNLRRTESLSEKNSFAGRNLESSRYDLYMNGPEIFNFTLRVVPDLVHSVLDASGLCEDDIDFFVPHQANSFMLKHLRDKLDLPEEKFIIDLDDVGNTVSSTIPLTLARLQAANRLETGMRIMVLGFGVGLSWAGAVVTWP